MPARNERGGAPGFTIPILGGAGDGGQFFVGDTQLLANAMDAVSGVVVDLGDGVRRVFTYWTFIGNEVETNKPKAVTLIMPVEMLKAIPGNARQLYLSTPIEFRNSEPERIDMEDPDAFLRALRRNSEG